VEVLNLISQTTPSADPDLAPDLLLHPLVEEQPNNARERVVRDQIPDDADCALANAPVGSVTVCLSRTQRVLAGATRAAGPLGNGATATGPDSGPARLASGQVFGVIDDLPTCEELIERIVMEAAEQIRAAGGKVL
jgi:NAD(P)H-dependent flavin oxidoreductase YrpB (nitropropane dioxygenase family)